MLKLFLLFSAVKSILIEPQIDASLSSIKGCATKCELEKDDCISECVNKARSSNKKCGKIRDRDKREKCIKYSREDFENCCEECHIDCEECLEDCEYEMETPPRGEVPRYKPVKQQLKPEESYYKPVKHQLKPEESYVYP